MRELLKLRVTGRRADQEVLNIISQTRTLAYFVTEAVGLVDDIGVCMTENHYAQTMGNHRVRSP